MHCFCLSSYDPRHPIITLDSLLPVQLDAISTFCFQQTFEQSILSENHPSAPKCHGKITQYGFQYLLGAIELRSIHAPCKEFLRVAYPCPLWGWWEISNRRWRHDDPTSQQDAWRRVDYNSSELWDFFSCDTAHSTVLHCLTCHKCIMTSDSSVECIFLVSFVFSY